MLSINSCHTSNTRAYRDDDKNIKEPETNTNNTNRNAILNLIVENPGIRYRELLRLTDLSNGVLAYHLKEIEKSKPILVVRQNKKTTRYYSSDIPFEEISIIGQIRHSTRRRILTFILKRKVCTFDSIVEHANKAPSTVFWHLKALLEAKSGIH
ncbi:MAG: winged helix-turn-helix transcriptional regulator [Candidatus Nitrosopolaris sp.]